MGNAVAQYLPESYDEAVATMNTVTGYLDIETLSAGDVAHDESYTTLIALRQGVVETLTTIGATLPGLKDFSFRRNMLALALALANRIYQDPARSDELIQQANPIHPAFMPPRFEVWVANALLADLPQLLR